MNGKEEFLKKSAGALSALSDRLGKLPDLHLSALEPERTALVVIDMVNGFARKGALQSPEVEALIPKVAALSEACRRGGIARVFFADCHGGASPEFGAYPPHCLKGTEESEIVDELKSCGGYALIPKNSTNGFHEKAFSAWLSAHPKTDVFLLAGDCTDICIQQFALALKTAFNCRDRESRVIVPRRLVATYDLPGHPASLMEAMAFAFMMQSGVEAARDVLF